MLKEDILSVTEISMRCGFDTIRHFNRVFKDITGMAPRQAAEGVYVISSYDQDAA